MLSNGRPRTTTEEGVALMDDALLTDLPDGEQAVVKTWIDRHLSPTRKTFHPGWSSYGLKHILQSDTGIYVTDNQFKDAMILCGYEPEDPNEVSWHFRLSRRSGAFKPTSGIDRSVRLDDAEIMAALAEIAAAVRAKASVRTP